MDELAFRVRLAYCVIVGRVPLESEQRYWARSIETPVAIDVLDWTDNRRLFTVLVWPSLESDKENALEDQAARTEAVKEVIARGAQEMAWSMLLQADFGLRWDNSRKVWTAQDGFGYDGAKDKEAA